MSPSLERWVPVLLCVVALFAVCQKFIALGSTAPEWVSSKSAEELANAVPATATTAVAPTSCPPDHPMTWLEFFSQSPHMFMLSLWSGSVLFRALFVMSLVLNARRIFDATRLPRGPSLAHWAGAVIAHRGYRSEAQQLGQLVQGSVRGDAPQSGPVSSGRHSRKSSRAASGAPTPPSHSRSMSRDEPMVNPIVAAASASLTAVTFGTSTPVSSDGVPLPFSGSRRRLSQAPSGVSTPVPMLGLRRSSPSSAFGSPFASSRSLAAAAAPALDPANYNIPENSMLAFIYAHEQGVHGVEVDVCLTKDGHILVMHDNTLDRTMDATGEVPHLTLEQIRQFKYRQVTTQEYTIRDPRNRSIDIVHAPTLEYVIEFCRDRHLKLMIESKEYTNFALMREKLHALYEKYDMYSWSYVASFNPVHIWQVRRHHPLIPTCLLYCRTCIEWYHVDESKEMLLPKWINHEHTRRVLDWLLWYFSPTLLADWLGVSMVGPHNILISPALITSLTTRGIVCDVWVCNAELEKQWLQSLGCIVTSDRLFSHDDISPFPESAAAEAAARTAAMSAAGEVPLAPSPSLDPMVRRPSIFDALEHVAQSYYSNHPAAGSAQVTPVRSPENGSVNDKAAAAAEAADAADSTQAASADSKPSGSNSGRISPSLVDGADSSLIGEGSVSLKHLRLFSEGGAGTPLMSPASFAIAEERLPSSGSEESPEVPVVAAADAAPASTAAASADS